MRSALPPYGAAGPQDAGEMGGRAFAEYGSKIAMIASYFEIDVLPMQGNSAGAAQGKM